MKKGQGYRKIEGDKTENFTVESQSKILIYREKGELKRGLRTRLREDARSVTRSQGPSIDYEFFVNIAILETFPSNSKEIRKWSFKCDDTFRSVKISLIYSNLCYP